MITKEDAARLIALIDEVAKASFRAGSAGRANDDADDAAYAAACAAVRALVQR